MMANSSSFKKKIIRLITPDTAYDYKKGPLWNQSSRIHSVWQTSRPASQSSAAASSVTCDRTFSLYFRSLLVLQMRAHACAIISQLLLHSAHELEKRKTKITRITETEIIPPYYNLKMSLDKRRKRIIRVHFYCQKPKNEATKMFSIIPFSRGARKIVLHGTRAIETKQRTPLGRLMPNALPPYQRCFDPSSLWICFQLPQILCEKESNGQ